MFDAGVLFQELGHAALVDLPLVLAVNFVADQNEGEFLRLLGSTLVEELGDPGLDIVEGLGRSGSTLLLVIS